MPLQGAGCGLGKEPTRFGLKGRQPPLADAGNQRPRSGFTRSNRGHRFALRTRSCVSFWPDPVGLGGGLGRAYLESDATGPLNAYGRSKAEAERQVLAAFPAALVVRTAAFFSPHDPYNFAHFALAAAQQGRAFPAAADVFATPTYVPDLVEATLDLLIDGEAGIWHLSNAGRRSWAEFAQELLGASGLDQGCVEPVPGIGLGWQAPRPRDTALASLCGQHLPSLEQAVGCYAASMAERLPGRG